MNKPDETTPLSLVDLKPLPYDRSLASRFLEKHGISASWKRQTGDPKKRESVLFSIVLKRRGRAEEPLVVWESFNYTMGWGCFKADSDCIPELGSVVACLVSDIYYLTCDNSFENFVHDSGLEKDAIQARARWTALKKEYRQLYRLMGSELMGEFARLPEPGSDKETELARTEAEDSLAEAAGEQPG